MKGPDRSPREVAAIGLGTVAEIALIVLIMFNINPHSVKTVFWVAIFLIPASLYFWQKNEARAAWEWFGLSAIGSAAAFFFVWLDCQGERPEACARGGQGFSFVLTLAATGYAIACVGGLVQAWIRNYLQRQRPTP